MKVLCIFLLCLAFAASQSSNPCFRQCSPVNAQCPFGADCLNTQLGGSTIFGCVCNSSYVINCNSISGTTTCDPRVNSGCGPAFPSGCPAESECITASAEYNGGQWCRCRDPNYVFDATLIACRRICPDFSSRDTTDPTRCVCWAGYVQDTSVNFFRCRPSTTSTCASLQVNNPCPVGFHCEDTATAGPRCVEDYNVPRCGYNFRCPDETHFMCIDTSTGPTCRCRSPFAGTNCMNTECWRVNDQLGCWWPNGFAECVSDNSANTNPDTNRPYCRCLDGHRGEDCSIPDNLCTPTAVAACEQIPNSRCVEGRCICREGYVSISTNGDITVSSGGCREVNPPGTCDGVDCTGNRVCVEIPNSANGDCRCPTDLYGSSDCSRPRCENDTDCTRNQENAFCVRNTPNNVPPFCACRPGFTGPECRDPAPTCGCTDTNRECDNEGLCRCRAGRTGDNCEVDDTVNRCRTITIRISREDLSNEDIRTRIIAIIGVDVTNVRVEGPFETDRGGVLFIIYLCESSDVDADRSRDDLQSNLENGNDGGMGFEEIDDGTSSSSTASAAVLAVSLATFGVALL